MTHDGVLKGLNWSDKTLLADTIYEQVNALLSATGEELHQTPRRPDVRMILQNTRVRLLNFTTLEITLATIRRKCLVLERKLLL
jgi:hypothetical protein